MTESYISLRKMNRETRYKWCFVPKCKNTTMKTPTKLFTVHEDKKRTEFYTC